MADAGESAKNPSSLSSSTTVAVATVKDAEPSSQTNGTPAADAPQPRPAMAIERPELDDFGLPIRQFSAGGTPLAKRPDRSADSSPKPQGKEPGTPKKKKGTDHALALKSKSPKSKKDKTEDSGSDDDIFKDAPSKPPSDAPDAEDDSSDGPLTPVPPTPRPKTQPNDDSRESEDGGKDATLSKETVSAETSSLEAKVEGKDATKKVDHSRDTSVASATVGMSEFSHQQLTAKKEDKADEDDLGWQEMPAYAPYDIYDDDNKLVAKEHDEEADETYGYSGLGGAGKGYTRVDMDEDAESATSMDDNTKYLFQEAIGTSIVEDDEHQRDAVSQMQATKDLLTEGQRIAYVGLTRLEIAGMVKEAEAVEQTRRTKKEVNTSAEATKMWGQKMMIRLYTHMDISAAEQVMVEQLSDHGVIPQDLTPVLMTNARVNNPMADGPRSSRSLSSPGLSPRPPASPVPPEEEKAAEPPPPYEIHEGEELPEVKTPSQLPTTEKIDIDLRWTVLCDLFLLLIADSVYDSRSRVLLERVGKSLEILWLDIRKFEKRVTDALEMQQAAEKENWNEDEHMENRRKRALRKRYVMMGLATVGGGLVIGLSAGLLAPVIGGALAAGLATIGVTGPGTFIAGAGGIAVITSGAAASGSVIGGRAANRRTGAVKTFEYRPLHNNKRVNLIVTVSGWMTGKVDDVRLPYSTVDPIMGDIYSVLWEPEMLTSMGDTINILATEALTTGLQQVLATTFLMGVIGALQLPIILTKLSYLIDNPWAVSLDRATAAGLILADSLIDRNLGTRPVTLVGYSLGSRVIFSCLQELARKGAYGLVQNVYIFGSPIVVKKDEYLRARTVVPGRFVNGYCRNDWILGYLFRITGGGIRRVAGLGAIEEVPWLENMDVTDIVKGHMEYRKAMPRLLRECGWAVESDEFTEIEDPDPENHDKRQRELINEIEEARKELEKSGKAAKGGRFSLFGRRKKALEKEDWEVYEDTLGKENQAQRSEDGMGNNHGVLFDVEAIRAELAKDKMEVRELPTTLPPMKLDLTASPLTPPLTNPRDSLRETKSADHVALSAPHDSRRLSQERTPTLPKYQEFAFSPNHRAEPSPHEDDDIQMTFDTSFNEPAPPPPPPPAKDVPAKETPGPSRPEMKTAQTVPNIVLADPWGDPDDEDFGKEKEISMTFA